VLTRRDGHLRSTIFFVCENPGVTTR
jgi:hypothetical protein